MPAFGWVVPLLDQYPGSLGKSQSAKVLLRIWFQGSHSSYRMKLSCGHELKFLKVSRFWTVFLLFVASRGQFRFCFCLLQGFWAYMILAMMPQQNRACLESMFGRVRGKRSSSSQTNGWDQTWVNFPQESYFFAHSQICDLQHQYTDCWGCL